MPPKISFTEDALWKKTSLPTIFSKIQDGWLATCLSQGQQVYTTGSVQGSAIRTAGTHSQGQCHSTIPKEAFNHLINIKFPHFSTQNLSTKHDSSNSFHETTREKLHKILPLTSNSFSLWILGTNLKVSTGAAKGGCQSYTFIS